MESLYPAGVLDTSLYGDQTFAPGYTPRALDSVAAAKARMIAHMELQGVSQPEAVAVALDGADEVAVVNAIYDEVMEERKKLLALDRTKASYESDVAATVVDLDPAKWIAARPKLAAAEPMAK